MPASFTVVISDRRGGLAALARIIAESGASIKAIAHDRAFSGPDIHAVNAVCTVETRDHTHVKELHRALRRHGFPLAVAK
jgi:threonine dehydratase